MSSLWMVFAAVVPFVVFIVWLATQARNPSLPAAAKGRKHKEIIIIIAVMGIVSFCALLYAYSVLGTRHRVATPAPCSAATARTVACQRLDCDTIPAEAMNFKAPAEKT